MCYLLYLLLSYNIKISIMKLISMTSFVKKYYYDESRDELQTLDLFDNYATFLLNPLKLEMFVPCDENGNVLKEPDPINWQNFTESEEYRYIKFKEAKEGVLFKGVKMGSYGNGMFHFLGLGKSYLIINGIIYDDNQNSAPQPTEDVIEDLLYYNDYLDLTESALKYIGINE